MTRSNKRSRFGCFADETKQTRNLLESYRLHVESLEERILLSADVSLNLGTISDGQSISIEYDAQVDSPFPKGLTQVWNQADVSGSNITATTTNPIFTPVDRAPQVAAVFVNGTGWDPLFRAEAGDATFGYQIPDGLNQLDILPWVDIDEISIRFTEQVDIQLVDLTIQSIDPINIAAGGFSYDASTATATWKLTSPIGSNKVRLIVDGTSAGAVTDAAGNQELDGEWNELGTAVFNSGDGVAGGDFNFRFDVQPGDVTGEGNTTVTDLVNISSKIGSAIGGVNYDIFFDVNGSGGITVTDLVNTSANVGTTQPGGEPAGGPASGWSPNATAPPVPGAGAAGDLDMTKGASLTIDVDGDGVADPGDTLRYSVTIDNNAGFDALSVVFADCFHPNLSLVAGSINVSPVATDDNFAGIGNTLFELSSGGFFGTNPSVKVIGSLFDNDSGNFFLDSFDSNSAQGATVGVSTDGSFVYTPVAGVTSLIDTFTYTIASGPFTSTGTVSVDLSGLVWYVDDGAGAGGAGISTDPFNSFAPVNGGGDVDGVGDFIYVSSGSGGTTAGIQLENSQQLIGEGVDLIVNSLTLQAAGSRPTLVNGSGDGIDLAGGNTIRGLNIGNTSGTGLTGSGFGTATIDNVSINGTGQGIDIDTGSGTFTFDEVSVNGGSHGIDLESFSGTLTVSGTTTIDGTSGAAIRVLGTTGATVDFGATSIGSTSTVDSGIDIQSGFASTFTFDSLDVATNSGVGLLGIFGGTIDVGGVGNSISAAGGAAVVLINTDVSGFTFSSILANVTGGRGVHLVDSVGTKNFANLNINNTGMAGFEANNGGTVNVLGTGSEIDTTGGTALDLVNTTIGTSGMTFQSISSSGGTNGIVLDNTGTSGGLTITGDGSGTQNGSGGSILNSTGDGISLTNAQDISFSQLNITNSGDHGIDISSVADFTFQDAIITGAGNADDEHSVRIVNLFGTSLIEDVDFDNINEDAVEYVNNTADDGVRDVLTVRRGDFNDHDAGFGEMGIDVQATGTSLMGLVVDNSTFDINANGSLGVIGSSVGSGNLDLQIINSTFNAGAAFGSGGIQISNAGNSTGTNTISGNQILGSDLIPLVVNNDDNANSSATISGNTITGSGALNNGFGMQIRQDENGVQTVLVSNNNISNMGFDGIRLNARDSLDGNSATGVLNATVLNNTVSAAAIFGSGLISIVDEQNTLNLKAEGNNLTGGGFAPDIQLTLSDSASTMNVTAADATALSTANNSAGVTITNSAGGTLNFGAADPPLPLKSAQGEGAGVFSPLAEAELAVLVDEAVSRWETTGLTKHQQLRLDALTFSVSDLPDIHLGLSHQTHIWIDINAAGWGWFVDHTPRDDTEFEIAAGRTELWATQNSDAYAHMDLLTVVLHEVGHVLGRDHDGSHSVMADTLPTGTRRLLDNRNSNTGSLGEFGSTTRLSRPAMSPAARSSLVDGYSALLSRDLFAGSRRVDRSESEQSTYESHRAVEDGKPNEQANLNVNRTPRILFTEVSNARQREVPKAGQNDKKEVSLNLLFLEDVL